MIAIIPNPSGLVRPVEPSRSRTVAPHRDVLLATDASPAAFAATRFVHALATQWLVTPHVITVVPPPPMAIDPMGANVVFGASLEEELRREVQRQLETCSAAEWPRAISSGSPAAEIIREAELRGSDLIVLGLRPHALVDRVFRNETALTVMRQASVPVLAVTAFMKQVPQRVAVAIDFSRASIAAARAALTMLDDGGSMLLVYVEPPSKPATDDTEGYSTIYAQGVAAAFNRLRTELASRAHVNVETVVLNGSVVPELLAFAQRANVDLIAVGSQRHSIARRAFVGGVTTALTRSAACSLLVLPPGRRSGDA